MPARPRIFEHLKNGIMPIFNGFLPQRGHLEFSGVFFLVEMFEKVSFDPYNFRITRLSARKSEQMKKKLGDENNIGIHTQRIVGLEVRALFP